MDERVQRLIDNEYDRGFRDALLRVAEGFQKAAIEVSERNRGQGNPELGKKMYEFAREMIRLAQESKEESKEE